MIKQKQLWTAATLLVDEVESTRDVQINEIILVVFKLLNCGAIINCKLLIKAAVERINNNHVRWKVLLLNTTVKKKSNV